MSEVTQISQRKNDHIRINLEEKVNFLISTGLENYRFQHRALPEIDLESVEMSQILFGKIVKAPLLISSMTGGTEQAAEINRNLALAAQSAGIAMGVGSQRAAIENPSTAASFNVRKFAPDILLFANLGGVQLNYGFGASDCQKAVDMIQADALILHFNALQEAVQPEGNTRFAGLLNKIEQVCKALSVPVIAKEVGWGFSDIDVRNLANAGVKAIDVAGSGGTSWSQVEKYRASTENQAALAEAFINWGIPTAEAVEIACAAAPELIVIASGGIRSGIDIAKTIALGASMGGMAGPFLKAAVQSYEKTLQTIELVCRELQIAMFAAGAENIDTLQRTPLFKIKSSDSESIRK